MIRKALLGLAFGLAASCAYAQAPSPADVGVSKGTPDVFKLKGHDNIWTPFGSVDPSTHIFIPGTNGSIAPNDCLKWGPGITSAGMACGSGGGGGSNQLTIYTSHSGLVNNVTTPTEAWTVVQQGFYAPGDGGDAVYQWSFTSYCAGGTSGSPKAADGIGCVLPIGQSASTAGRYLLSTSNGELNARQVGMMPGGQDNYPLVQTLMNAISPGNFNEATLTVVLPATLGQSSTYYYFSQPFSFTRNVDFNCKAGNVANESSVVLMFPPGVDGMIQNTAYLLPGGGWGQSRIRGCKISSMGHGSATLTLGSANLTGVQLGAGGNAVPDPTFTLPASCNPSGGVCTVGVGDGLIVMTNWVPPDGALSVAPGAYVSASNPGAQTVTLASPYTVIGQLVAPSSFIWDLPAAQKYTVQTTLGSNSITVTAGPRPLGPGDMLWSDAFLFGSSVSTVNGNTFPQTITVEDVHLFSPANALVTHTSGSPGQMWAIPVGVKRRVEGSMIESSVKDFGIGLDMICQSSTNPSTGCNSSFDQHNTIGYNLVGRLARGNTTGVATSIANIYGGNTIADIVEAGSIGSTYVSEEANSQDGGTSIYGVLVLCGGQNFSNFFGTYLSGQDHGPCMGTDAQGNVSIGVKADDTGVPSELFIGSVYGLGNIAMGAFNAPTWLFAGPPISTQTTTVATASGTVIAVPTVQTFYPGLTVTDLTHPVIPANTTIVSVLPNSVTISAALTGSIQIGDQIQFSNRGGPCIGIYAGLVNGNMAFDTQCAHYGMNIGYNGYYGGWSINGMFMPDDNYKGYNRSDLRLPIVFNGLQLSNASNYVGEERTLDGGYSVPNSPDHLQGDARLNTKPVPGGNLAWTDAPSFTTSLAGAVTGGTTTTVTVAACPSSALPAGTPVVDVPGISVGGLTSVSQPLGTLASCTATTLTLQAAATNSGASGDTIQFLQWYPAARVANDPGGTSWPLGSPTTIASLARCTPETIGFGVVKNGATSKADDDEVGKEGSSVRPVFCNGEKWKYLGGGIH